ncbi:hypothetical protein DdX_20178 [Ditylenchus destructor]|uniref:Uncharacterized protein n=1 Tax=Ditylenchus destructor TaxID=166010 RepID=A0AAD4MGR4_9BILA|nr:hypothetical protein DdX_20178 [Ditylenchus destructor]
MWIAIALCLACCVAGYKCQPSSNQVSVNASQNIGVINGQVGLPSGTTTSAPYSTTTSLMPGRRKRDSNQVNANVSQNVANPIQSNDQIPVQTGNTTSASATSTTTILPTAPGRSKRSRWRFRWRRMLTRTLALSMVKSTPETQPTYRPRQIRQQRHQPFRLDVESEAMVDTGDSSDDNKADSNEVY